MSLNVGYLTAKKDNKSDEVYTPELAVKMLLPFIKSKDTIIWCPFDEEDSEYVKVFRNNGYNVINSHINDGRDFFKWTPDQYDIIISNPPFSKKDEVLKRLYELDKPYAMLLPLPSLQGQKRFKYLRECQAIIFDKRINFFKDKERKEIQKGISFASIYICRKFLDKDLIFMEYK